MSALDHLYTHDLSTTIAHLPRKLGAVALPFRPVVRSATLHFSAVRYQDRSEAAELAVILAEARFHLGKNWSNRKGLYTYGSAYMYDAVALSSGALVRCQSTPKQLWHCKNAIGNRSSFSLHVLLGQNQDLTPAQRATVIAAFDAVRADNHFDRSQVFGHCEWPVDGTPARPSSMYMILPGQSACPGPVLHRHVVAYRIATDALASLHAYRVRAGTGKVNIRASATTAAAKRGELWPGDRWEGIEQAGEWVDQGGTRSNRWVVGLDGRAVWRPVFE